MDSKIYYIGIVLLALLPETSAVGASRGLAQTNETGPLPPPLMTYKQVSVGVFVTCAIADTPNSELYCVGNNDDGAIGDGTQISKTRPTLVAGGGDWVGVSGGDWHVCGSRVVDDTPLIYCWGYNGGRLGTGLEDPIQATTPQLINGSFSSVSAGHFHSCAVSATETEGTEGQAYCWGTSSRGRLGNGKQFMGEAGHGSDEGFEYSPQKVVDGMFDYVVAKGSHSCGYRKADNSVYCWGGNDDGEICVGELGGNYTEPTRVPGEWKYLAIGLKFTALIDMEDNLYVCGALKGGGTTAAIFDSKPELVGGGHKWKTVSGGMQHGCGLLLDNTARCFGLGWHGQLGNGLNTSYLEPYAEDCPITAPCEPKGGGTWLQIEAGEYNSCGIKTIAGSQTGGELVCTGENPYGQLGTGVVGGNWYEFTRMLDPETIIAPAPAPLLTPGIAPAPIPPIVVVPPVVGPNTGTGNANNGSSTTTGAPAPSMAVSWAGMNVAVLLSLVALLVV